MLKKIIIFDTPQNFTHPLLTNTIQGSDFLIAILPEGMINKVKQSLDYDMIIYEDVNREMGESSKLKKHDQIDYNITEKIKNFENHNNEEIANDKPELTSEIKESIDLINEKFLINTDSSTQLMLNSFISPHILKILQGPTTLSNTGQFIINENLIYTHDLDEIYLWAQVEKGKYFFSNDDDFLLVKKNNESILYRMSTMEKQVFEQTDRIVFGKDILILDYMLIELKEGVSKYYKALIRDIITANKKESLVNAWVDSDEDQKDEKIESRIFIKDFEDIWFSPFNYSFVTVVDDKLTLFRANESNQNQEKITRMNISSNMIKSVHFTSQRCYAIITKYINNKLKYFLESYTDSITVNEVFENNDLTFRFSDESFIIGYSNVLQYYELKNKRFVLMNTIEKVCSSYVDLFKGFYCFLNENDDLLFYKGKTHLRTTVQSI